MWLRVKVCALTCGLALVAAAINANVVGLILEMFLEKPDIEPGAEALFEQTLDVLCIGLEGFANELSSQQVQVTQVDWRPPADGDAELAELLSKLGS